ncbi:MAG: hypothetical protein HYY18_18015 [Planctomycetes bacterium]|nr:hypothetical protein [Planctomycetota bacterium]
MRAIREATRVDEARAIMRDLTQFFYDAELGEAWLARVSADLQREDMKAIGLDALPDEIELTQFTLQDGRVLAGVAGPLARKYPQMKPEVSEGQWTCELALGVPRLSAFRLSPEMIRDKERVAVPLPKAVLMKQISEKYEGNRLILEGDWARPGKGTSKEVIELQATILTNGGSVFENRELGLRTFRWTAECIGLDLPDPLKSEFRGNAPEPRKRPEPDADAWAGLRAQAPGVEWPEPFVELPEAKAALDALAKEGRIPEEGDPASRLLRIRFAYVYGSDLPASALNDPLRFAGIEKATLAYLRGASLDDVLALDPSVEEASAIVRRGLHPGPAPRSGRNGDLWLSFPRDYHPWTRWPLLVTLHTQNHTPQEDIAAWGAFADEAGMILACPTLYRNATVVRTEEANLAVMHAVRRACLEFNVDPDRVYLYGLGSGAVVAWRLAQTYPDRWAAVLAEAAGPNTLGEDHPLLPNLAPVPLLVMIGEFNGVQTLRCRRAVKELRALGAKPEYVEAGFLGDARLPWRHPWALRWMNERRRPASRTQLAHFAVSAYEGRNSWLAIRRADGDSWDQTDARFKLGEKTGVEAILENGKLRFRILAGGPREVEIFHDAALMGEEIVIHGPEADTTWKPKPTAKRLLEEARATGERGRVYGDSIKVVPGAPK